MSRYSGAQGKGAARRTRELKQDEAEARLGPPAKVVEPPVDEIVEPKKR
jgi:hypothetical protein